MVSDCAGYAAWSYACVCECTSNAGVIISYLARSLFTYQQVVVQEGYCSRIKVVSIYKQSQ